MGGGRADAAAILCREAQTNMRYGIVWILLSASAFGQTITVILGTDTITSSRAVINENFNQLNIYTWKKQTYNDVTQISTPGTSPASGYLRVYAKTGSGICWKNSAGVETCAGSGGSLYWTVVGVGAYASMPAACAANTDVYVCNGTGCPANGGYYYCVATNTWTTSCVLPTQTGKAGSPLQTDGSSPYWATVATTTYDYCEDAGATDAYACSLAPAPTAYVVGMHARIRANTANTGAATVNLNSLGAKAIKKVAGGITTDLADNDIRAGQWVDLIYDGTNMQMQSTLGNAPAGSKYAAAFTSQTSITITGATHGLGTCDVWVSVFDTSSPTRRVDPDAVTCNATSKDIVLTFAVSQSGRYTIQ